MSDQETPPPETQITAPSRTSLRVRELEQINAELLEQLADHRRFDEAVRRMSQVFVDAGDPIIIEDVAGSIVELNGAAEREFGWRRDELVGKPALDLVASTERERAQAMREHCREGDDVRNIVATVLDKAGKPRTALTTLSLLSDAAGEPLGIAVLYKDISELEKVQQALIEARDELEARVKERTASLEAANKALRAEVAERKHAEQRLAAQYSVTSILASSPSIDDALPRLLRIACTVAGWEIAEYWRVDRDAQVLRWAGCWHTSLRGLEQFEELSRSVVIAHGEGLPGRVWATNQPAWIQDLGGELGPARRSAAAAHGLKAGFAFPIRSGGRVTGVLAFFSTDARAPDDALRYLLDALGHQIGEFIEARKADQELRQTEEALRGLHAITSNSELEVKDEVRALLRMGCQRFGMRSAAFVRVTDDECQVIESLGDKELTSAPLLERLCVAVHERGGPLLIDDVRYSEWSEHLPTIQHGVRAYAGIGVVVAGQRHGILSFANSEPRASVFTPTDREIMKLMAQWLGAEITRQQTDEEMLRRAAWLDSLISATQDALVSIDRQGQIVAFNPAAERMFGYLKQEVEGRNVAMLMAEPYATEHSRYVQSYERTKEARAVGRIRSVAGKRKNGEVFPIELSVADVDIDERVPYGAFIRDISEKVRLEARLLERERLASIGTMASMLAHEIGNPLNNMYLHAQILERRLKQHRDVCGEQVFRPLESLLGEIRRLMQLLEEFRSVSRRQTLSCHPTDVSDFVHGVLSVVAPDALQRNVTVDSAVGQDVVGVMDAEKIKQVVLNLCKNAIEAMPSGGTLRVASRLENGEVVIEIADTGVGIPQTLDVFEAFTTTKPEGTGLGLAISRQLVKAHGGSIQFASEVGRGTVFTVRLPADGPPPE